MGTGALSEHLYKDGTLAQQKCVTVIQYQQPDVYLDHVQASSPPCYVVLAERSHVPYDTLQREYCKDGIQQYVNRIHSSHVGKGVSGS